MAINYDFPKSAIKRKPFVPEGILPFGEKRTNLAVTIAYKDGEWGDINVIPYKKKTDVTPGTKALHYGQITWEGAKVFRHEDRELYLFRFEDNIKRMNKSNDILCIPKIPNQLMMQATITLVDIERNWYPIQEGATMYVRPIIFAADDQLGVSPSSKYTFFMFLSPSGPYFANGFDNPITMLLQHDLMRVAPGGTGLAKTPGNYAASLRPGLVAKKLGASQVLYTDINAELIEEAGSNNVYIVKDGKVLIPDWRGKDTILHSITTKSLIELGDNLGFGVKFADIKVDQFLDDLVSGAITESGGLGTAAVVAPIGSYLELPKGSLNQTTIAQIVSGKIPRRLIKNMKLIEVGDGKTGPHTKTMYETITDIQFGRKNDTYGWLTKVSRDFEF